jgi:hypothetical protein
MIEVDNIKIVTKPDDEYVYFHLPGVSYIATKKFLKEVIMYYIGTRAIKPFDDFLYEQTPDRQA